MSEFEFIKNDDGTYDVVIDTESSIYKDLASLAAAENLSIEEALNKVFNTILCDNEKLVL